MKLLIQMGYIFFICLLGEGLALIIPVSVPGSLLSMALLFAGLILKAVKEEQIDAFCDFLLGNIAVFFVPSAVGIMNYFDLLSGKWIALILICLISTIVTFAVTAWVTGLVMKLQGKAGEDHV